MRGTLGSPGRLNLDRSWNLGQTGAQQSPENGSKPPENLLNASSKPFQAQTSPPCWQGMNQAKNAKLST
jgi:hypothetical protein